MTIANNDRGMYEKKRKEEILRRMREEQRKKTPSGANKLTCIVQSIIMHARLHHHTLLPKRYLGDEEESSGVHARLIQLQLLVTQFRKVSRRGSTMGGQRLLLY